MSTTPAGSLTNMATSGKVSSSGNIIKKFTIFFAKRTVSRDEYFLKSCKVKSVHSACALMILKFVEKLFVVAFI